MGDCIDFKHYWSEPDTFPFLVYINDELAGFVIINKQGSESAVDFNMAQFFILRKFKNKSISKQIAVTCFNDFSGKWVIVMPDNKGAYQFWKSVISQYAHNDFSEYTIFGGPTRT